MWCTVSQKSLTRRIFFVVYGLIKNRLNKAHGKSRTRVSNSLSLYTQFTPRKPEKCSWKKWIVKTSSFLSRPRFFKKNPISNKCLFNLQYFHTYCSKIICQKKVKYSLIDVLSFNWETCGHQSSNFNSN